MLSLEDIESKEVKIKPHLDAVFAICKENEIDIAIVLKFDDNTMALKTMGDNGLIRITGHDVPPSWTIE